MLKCFVKYIGLEEISPLSEKGFKEVCNIYKLVYTSTNTYIYDKVCPEKVQPLLT